LQFLETFGKMNQNPGLTEMLQLHVLNGSKNVYFVKMKSNIERLQHTCENRHPLQIRRQLF
jgi:hypothetical protein